jgi:plastocyanin
MSFAGAAAVMGLLGCATGMTLEMAFAGADTAAVNIDNFSFTPQRVTVKAGTLVIWTNQDDIPHTVMSTTKEFNSKALDTDDKFSLMFATPGSYDYFCSLHPHMTGIVVVE